MDMVKTVLQILIILMMAADASAQPADPNPNYTPMTPEQHREKFNYTRVQPLFDTLMRDCAIARGPDGVYHLTGTIGTPREDGTVDFAINDGIRLWRSNDLKAWEELGLVAPLSLVNAKVGDLRLVRTTRYENEFKGLIAPEIHFIKGGVYLTYALKPCGTGLLKSTSGKPEGPYEDLGLIMKAGQDASLFVDDDGSVYWVSGGGWIARMKDNMTGLAERPRLIRPHDERNDVGPGGQILQVGQAGAFLFKKDGKYHMLAAGIHGRIGVPCYDTFVAVADSLEGPWSRRLVAVAHGGQTTMFEGPEGQWYSTFSGIDSRAALRDRPAIVPVNWVDSITYYSPKNLTWPLKPAHIITEAWGWENARPLLDVGFRDIGIVNGRDGYFYFSGLHGDNRLNKANVFCRGKDLTGAEPWDLVQFPGLEVVTDLPWYEYVPQKTDGWNNLRMSSCKLFDVDGTFYATASAAKQCGILRSTSETMRGPWEVAKERPYGTIRGSGHIKTDMQGDLWLALRSHLWPVTPDFEFDLDREVSGKDGYVPSRSRSDSYAVEIADGSSPIRGDVGRYFYKIDGKYMMLGTAWHGNYRGFGTYDNQVFWADDLIGPWHHSRAVLPHGGHAGLVKDNDGQWWSTSFGNDPFLPDGGRVRAVPVDIKWNGERYVIQSGYPDDPSRSWRHEEERLVPTGKELKAALPVVHLPDDLPIIDPAICRGPDAVYYLTGTAGANPKSRISKPESQIDFHNNDGVYLWQSSDLTNWQALGIVASLGSGDKAIIGGKNTISPKLGYYYSQPDSLEPRYDRGMIAPKLYCIEGEWWIAFSMSCQKIGLLKSKSGRPHGPYQSWGQFERKTNGWLADIGTDHESNTDAYFFAYDPSLFVAADGAAYCLFGPGWIARLTPDLRAFAEKPRLLQMEGTRLYAGKGGCSLRHHAGRYVLTSLTEWGDTVKYTADSLHGPYGSPRLVLAQSGHVGMFKSNEGEWTAVVSHHQPQTCER